MASKTDIGNLALIGMGSLPVIDIEANLKSANTLRAVWDTARDAALRDHPWNFATQRVSLAQLDETPPFGYGYVFQLPTDNLRVLGMVGAGEDIDSDLRYKLEGQKLLTNESAANIKYIRRVTDCSLYDAAFVVHFAFKLALLTCKAITGIKPNRVELEESINQLGAAKTIDAQEDTPEVEESNPWMDARA